MLSNLDKLIEKLMHEMLMGFLNDQKVLVDLKKNSTAQAVISLIENIEKAIDNKVFVCGVFFWFAKSI